MVCCKQKNERNIIMEQNSNKQIVINFYKKVIGEQDLEYAKKIVTENYIQHNPQVKTGKEGLLEAITYLKEIPKPKKAFKPFMRIIADHNYVVVHMNIEFNGQKKIVLDLFRLENGFIAEHWDAIQNESEISLNGNSEIKGPIVSEDQEATLKNKTRVQEFTKQVLINRDFDALKKYMATDLIQHNPNMTNGLHDMKQYYQKNNIQKVYKIIGQGNFVVTQSKGIVNNQDNVFYDIYRLKNGLIVEHWSVSQIIPEIMAHTNGML